MVERVVVATDRSETAERAVNFASEMANRYGAELVLVQVLGPDVDTEELPEPRVDLAATELSRIAADVCGPKGRASMHILPSRWISRRWKN